MVAMNIRLSVSGTESIEAEFRKLGNEFFAVVQKSVIPMVGEQMKAALKRHVEDDVYRAYHARVYIRRDGSPGFGTALSDMENTVMIGTAGGRGMSFDYRPSGSNSATTADLRPGNKYYNADNPEPIKPEEKAVHGDDLIRRIETGVGYDWQFRDDGPGERPFWQNFVNEMIDGAYELFFADAVQHSGYPEFTMFPGSLERQDGDGEY